VMKRFRDLNLALRIALSTFLFGSIVGLALTFAFSQYTRRSMLSLAEFSLEEEAHHTSHFVDELLASRIETAEILAAPEAVENAMMVSNEEMEGLSEETRLARIAELDAQWRATASIDDPFIAQYLENGVALELRRQVLAHPGTFGEIFITDRFGALIASTGKLSTLAHGHKPWWQAAYNEGRGSTFIDDRGYDASVGDYVVGIVVPVMVDGQVIGILKCNFFLLGSIGKTIANVGREEEVSIYLARSNGLIVSGPGVLPLQTSLPGKVIDAIAERETRGLIVEENGERFLIALAEVSCTSSLTSEVFGGTPDSVDHSFGNAGESWFIVAKQNSRVALTSALLTTRQVGLVALGVVFLVAIFGLLAGWRGAKPVEKLVSQVRSFDSQSLDVRVPVQSNNEMGRLAQSFNEVAEQLETSVVSRDRLTEEVSRRELVEKVLSESEKKYRRLFERMVSGFALHEMVLDPEGKPIDYTFLDINAAFEKMVGQSRDAIVGRRVTEVLPGIENDPANWIGTYGKVALGGSDITFEQYSEPLGKWFSILAYAPREGQFATIFQDITERRKAEEALEESEERFHDLIEHAHDLIQSVDPNGHFQYVNSAWLKTLGYKESEIDRLTLLDILHPDSRDHCTEVFQSVMAGKAVDHVEAEFISKGGDRIPVEGSVSCRFKDGRPFSTRAIFRDVTERRQYEVELALMARRDPLTGALNRYALDELLKQEAKRSGRYAHSIGFLMIDVNRFKEINDRFGHAMGDKVLQAIAALIQNNIRDADILVRYGGDEFLVILPETNGETDLVRERIQTEVSQRNKTNPLLDFPVTLAIGSYHWSSEIGTSIEEALTEADKLMYEDKRK